MGYPLAVSRLNEEQIKKIQGPMTPLILNRLSYIKKLKYDLAFGPRHYGGLGIPHMRGILLSAQISLFLRQLRSHDQPGELAAINIDQLQLSTGVGYPIFQFPTRPLPHLEGTWLPYFRESIRAI